MPTTSHHRATKPHVIRRSPSTAPTESGKKASGRLFGGYLGSQLFTILKKPTTYQTDIANSANAPMPTLTPTGLLIEGDITNVRFFFTKSVLTSGLRRLPEGAPHANAFECPLAANLRSGGIASEKCYCEQDSLTIWTSLTFSSPVSELSFVTPVACAMLFAPSFTL